MGLKILGYLKNKKVLLSAIAVLVLVAVSAAAFYFIPWRESARDFYLDAESRNFKKYADIIKKTYNDFNEAQQPYLTGSCKRRMEITLDAKWDGEVASGSNNFGGILDVVRKCKLVVDSKYNNNEKINLTGLSLLLEKTPFIDAEIFTRGRQLYFTVPAITPGKYFSLDLDKLNEVYERFSIPVKPLRIPSLVDAAGAVKLDGSEFDRLAEDYGRYISSSLNNEDVKYGKTVEVNISGEKTTGREVFVSLSKGSFSALLKALAAKAGSEDAFTALTYGNFADVSEIVDEAGIFRLFDFLDKTGSMALNEPQKKLLKAVNIKKDMDSFKKELVKIFDGCDFTNGLKIQLVIDKNKNILDRKAAVLVKNTKNGEVYEIKIHTGTNSLKYNDYRNRYLEVEVSAKPGSDKNGLYYFKYNPSMAPSGKNGKNTGSLAFSWGINAENGLYSSTKASFELDASIDELSLKENNSVKYDIEMKGSNEGLPEKIRGEVKTVKWKNNKLNTRNQTTEIIVNAELPDFGITGFSAALNLAREDRLGIEVFELPEAAFENVVDLNKISDEELNKNWQEIMGSFGTFYMTNKPILDAVLGE